MEEVFARVPHGACPVANQSFIRVAVNDDDAILSPEPTMKGKDFIMYDLKQGMSKTYILMMVAMI